MASDIPPPPPGFTLDSAPRKKKRAKDAVPPPPEGFTLDDPEATDGDTLKDGERRVRLWGADAPELGQQGWDRQGQPVPVGEQSRDYLQGEIVNTDSAVLGDVAHKSYGRLVGPVTLDGRDAAQGSIRSGNALAAPDYLADDPDRRFDYMEAERLARVNQLGPVNDNLVQPPADHRKNPDWVPERETIAQFWDTPTPFAGMRPEAEAEYVGLLRSGSPEQIVAFAESQGLGMDPEQVREWAAYRDAQAAQGKGVAVYPNYQRGPEVIQELGDGAMGAGVRGFGEGFVAGGLGELGAVADTLGGTEGRESVWNSDRRLADIWANNEFQNAAILRGDEFAHPTASTVGEVGGALTSGFVIPYGAGARSVAQLARVGGVYGAAEGFLGTDGSIPERLTGAAIGAPVGAILNAGLGKAVEKVAPHLVSGWQRLRGTKAEPAADIGIVERTQADWPEAMRQLQAGETEVVPGAVFNSELGPIDMRWGQAGDPEQNFENGFGLAHIIAKHEREGILRDLPERIAGMKVVETSPGGKDRVILQGPGGRAAVATTWHGDEQKWVLTAFDPNWKTPPGETSTPSPIGAGPDSGQRGDAPDIGPSGLPGNERTIGMDAEPSPSIKSDSLDDPQVRSLIEAGASEATINAVLKQRGLPTIQLGSVARARRLLDPATEAERAASAQTVQPRDVLPLPSNAVDGVDEAAAIEAGRFVEAMAPNELGELRRTTVRNFMGVSVPKVGPIDMVGWLRLRGGLKDHGGELAAMGLTNAARRGLEHVGQEARFGPLMNSESGMDLDDAAFQAWEQGYFPEFTERPTINEFLEALRDTHTGGGNRRFLPEDMPELERYSMAQADRYALEQQRFEEGGPVYSDRSNAVDEAPPFPPVEAYEEWPADAVKRAGNINLGKLETPQDIRRALVQTEKRVGFDAATRGRVTQAETERLAADLNMSPEQLLRRRKGQALNAEEALAARQLLAKSGNELVNAAKRMRALGDDPGAEALADFRHKWMRHVAIQEQVSGMTAEAGRALQQFRMAASSRAVRGDVLDALARGGGGKGNLQEAADVLLDAVEMGPGKFNALAAKAVKPKWHRKVGELYINFLLSNPPTHIVNMVSNSITAVAQIPEFALGAAIGGVRRALVGKAAKERILASEVGARTFGLIQGTKEGAHLFAKALRTGEADDFVSKVEGDEYKAIGGKLGEVIRVPTRLLTAEDQLFKGIARRMEINAQAVRIAHREGLKGEAREARIAELMADPTDAMLERAFDYGRYLTYQRTLGEFGRHVSGLSGSNLLAKVVIPFVRTPINLLKFATERSPAAPALKEWRMDVRAGGDRRDMALAKVMLGTGFATIMYQAAQEGRLTGAVPPDPAKAKLLYADGWQPYSFKIGDRYLSYSRLDPLATTLGVAADMATLPQGLSDRQQNDRATMLVASIMGSLASKTWLSGASAFTEALSDPGRFAGNWLERTVSSFAVPAGVAGVARAIDPVSRQREGIGEAIQARIPGKTDELFARRDIFGEPIVNDSLGPDFLSPFWQSRAKSDPVVAEMLRIGKSISAPGKYFTEDSERIDYTRERYDRYHEIAGRLTYNSLLGLIGSKRYQALDETGQRKAAKKAIRDARETARGVLDDPDYPMPDKGAPTPVRLPGDRRTAPDDGDVPPPPPGFSVQGEAAGRNVYRDLKDAIPGVRFTSGFRDFDYNQSLKARGYNAADNTTHMDGDTFDMLPPPGKSLGWLRARVKRYDPKAETLVHDGHLHARFPGYYGAPPIGGARSAGLRNPLAGLPPPPPGFTLN